MTGQGFHIPVPFASGPQGHLFAMITMTFRETDSLYVSRYEQLNAWSALQKTVVPANPLASLSLCFSSISNSGNYFKADYIIFEFGCNKHGAEYLSKVLGSVSNTTSINMGVDHRGYFYNHHYMLHFSETWIIFYQVGPSQIHISALLCFHFLSMVSGSRFPATSRIPMFKSRVMWSPLLKDQNTKSSLL